FQATYFKRRISSDVFQATYFKRRVSSDVFQATCFKRRVLNLNQDFDIFKIAAFAQFNRLV
ncbi:MAG: hypothetical protein V4629_10260, partial [Pseudomonadota bacterium]